MQSDRSFYIVLSLAFFLLMFAGKQAFAQGDAREFFKDGVSLFEKGEFKKAAESFRKAYTLKASWKMFYNIGQSEAAAKRYGLALEAFESYFAQGGDDVPANRREEVLKEIERLRMLVGVVEIDSKNGTELIVDDVSRGTTPFEGVKRIGVGRHAVVLRFGGEIIHDEMLTIAGGITTVIKLKDTAETVSVTDDTDVADNAEDTGDNTIVETSSVPETSEKARKLIIGGIIIGAVGLGAVSMGIGFTIKGGKDYEDSKKYADKYSETGADSDLNKHKDADDALGLDKTMLVIGYVTGGALMIAGTVMAIIGIKKKKTSNSDQVSVIPTANGLAVTF